MKKFILIRSDDPSGSMTQEILDSIPFEKLKDPSIKLIIFDDYPVHNRSNKQHSKSKRKTCHE